MFFNNKFNTFFGLNFTLVYTFPMCMTWRFHFPLRNYDFNIVPLVFPIFLPHYISFLQAAALSSPSQFISFPSSGHCSQFLPHLLYSFLRLSSHHPCHYSKFSESTKSNPFGIPSTVCLIANNSSTFLLPFSDAFPLHHPFIRKCFFEFLQVFFTIANNQKGRVPRE